MTAEFKKEISPAVFLQTAWRFRGHCLLIALSIILLINIAPVFKTKYYSATATMMNISDERAGGTNLFQVVGLMRSLNEGFFKFMAIIRSRTFQERVVQSLGPEFFRPEKGWKGTEGELKNYAKFRLGQAVNLRINPEQSNVLNVSVTYPDPQKAPIIANQVLVELQKYIAANSLTHAKRLEKYIEENIIETKAAIFETGVMMANFYKKYPVNPQKAMIENPLHKEVLKLSSLSMEEFDKDPLLRGSIGQLSEKRQNLLKRLKAIKEVPEQYHFDYLQEEFQILKEINLTLRQQYEMAKLEAVKQEPAFQILDLAEGSALAGMGKKRTFQLSLVIAMMSTLIYILFRCFYTPSTTRSLFQFLRAGPVRSTP